MAKTVGFSVSDGSVTAALRQLFKQLFEKKLVDAMLVPLELPSRENVVQSLVMRPEALDAANPLAPVLPVSTASIISKITKQAPSAQKMAVVARPCEMRAIIELAKLKQVSLDNILRISVDCYGTYSVPEYKEFAKSAGVTGDEFMKGVKSGETDRPEAALREACRVCEYPYPLNVDITIGLFGTDFTKEISLMANSAAGEAVLNGLGLAEVSGGNRQAAIDKLVAERTRQRDEVFADTLAESKGLEKLTSIFAPCIGCHNCRDVCPVCYCRECVFDSDTFCFEADRYLSWASRKGALRVPTDTLLFHLTRMNHMGTSCVGCGLCQEACPNDVPVFRFFRLIGAQVQPLFEYVPGRDIEEPLPLTTFKEDEFEKVGFE